MSTSKEDILKLRDLTRMTGKLTNVQIAQLKMWPKIILGANDGEVEFDPDEHMLTVTISKVDYKYIMEGATEPLPQVFNHRMGLFNTAVKFLLGDEYGVNVVMKGKLLGAFPPSQQAEPAHAPKFDK